MLVRLVRAGTRCGSRAGRRRGTRRSTRRRRRWSARSRPARGTGGRAPRPVARAAAPIASSTRPIFSIAFTAPPSSPVRCGMPAWPARPSTVIVGRRLPRHGDPDVEPARLGHDRSVGPKRPRHREPAGAGRLLLADRVDDQVAREPDPEPGERLGREHHGGDAALHVARPAAVNEAVLDHRRRTEDAASARRGSTDDDVDVAVEQQRAPAARPGKAGGELRSPGEREPVGHHRVPGDERRARAPRRESSAPHSRSRSASSSCSAASCRGGSPSVWVVVSSATRARDELDELVLRPSDLVADTTLVGRKTVLLGSDIHTELHLRAGERDNATVNPGTAALARGLGVLELLADEPTGTRSRGRAACRAPR